MGDWEAEVEAWKDEMIAKGHTPILEKDGRLNFLAYNEGFHNGPKCSKCGWSCCMHCDPIESIPPCT